MLVLSRKLNEAIHIDGSIIVKVVKVQGNRVYLGIDAPEEIPVLRGEIAKQKEQEAALAKEYADYSYTGGI